MSSAKILRSFWGWYKAYFEKGKYSLSSKIKVYIEWEFYTTYIMHAISQTKSTFFRAFFIGMKTTFVGAQCVNQHIEYIVPRDEGLKLKEGSEGTILRNKIRWGMFLLLGVRRKREPKKCEDCDRGHITLRKMTLKTKEKKSILKSKIDSQ